MKFLDHHIKIPPEMNLSLCGQFTPNIEIGGVFHIWDGDEVHVFFNSKDILQCVVELGSL